MKYINIFFMLCAISFAVYSLTNHKNCNQVVKQEIKENKSIKLYVYSHCGHCHDVIDFLKKNGWIDKVVIVNADDDKNYEDLKKLRGDGDDYCPFLVDEVNGKKVADSNKIIDYLKKIFKK